MTRHDPRLHRRPKRSARARPDFTIGEQPFVAVVDELPSLLLRYGTEHAKAPVDPDWTQLMRMSVAGILRMVTARWDGVLVGFALSHVGPHLMYKGTTHGITTAVWLDPAYRQGWNGYRLLRANRDMLLAAGCKRLCIAEDFNNARIARLYKRLGYKADEVSYAYG